MAGSLITIDIGDSQVRGALARLQAAGADMRDFFADIGESLLASTRARAAQEADPNFAPWPALSPKYAARKAREKPGLPILHFDGHLLGDMLSYQPTSAEVLVGTSAKYGATQQFGRGNIPARPFLGVSEVDEGMILQKANRYLDGAISG